MLVIVAPGQGAQTPGFLTPWLENPTFAERLTWLSAVSGLDLVHYGTEADAETIRDTAVAQPLLVAASLLAALELFPHPADAFGKIGAVAGHSVGELAAAAGARVITAEQAMVLVRERGKAMASAAAATPTSMTAVLGGDRDEVLAKLAEHGLTAANDNGPGQIVAAGTVEQLAALAEDAPAKARLVPLSVAGAFHTQHMAPAVEVLGTLARSVSTHDPRTPIISNRDGQVVHDGREVVKRIVTQVSNPVRWDLCMETMLDLGVTGILEMPPAGTLTGIAKRALKGVETFALKTPDQLDEARRFIDKHGSQSELDTNPTWRMLVAPAKGTFHQVPDLNEGDSLAPDTSIGAVASRGDETSVNAPHGGTIVEWLVEDGDLVSPGQPLIRLHPEGVN
ncbi:MAG: acyltransferase domain-containing protein [Nocardioides sp.]